MEKDVLRALADAAGVSLDEFMKRVGEKVRVLGGAVTVEAAAYLVAKEMGVDVTVFLEEYRREYQLKEPVSGLRGFTLLGTVFFVGAPRTFMVGGRSKRVMKIVVGDEKGSAAYVSLWSEPLIQKALNNIKRGSLVRISGGSVKKLARGIEISVSRGDIEVVGAGEELGMLELERGAANFKILGKVLDQYSPIYNDGSYTTIALVDSPQGIFRVLGLTRHRDHLKPGLVIEADGALLEERRGGVGDVFLGIDSRIDVIDEGPCGEFRFSVGNAYSVLYLEGPSYLNIAGEVVETDKNMFICSGNYCLPLYVRVEDAVKPGKTCLRGVFVARLSSGRPAVYFDRYSSLCDYVEVPGGPILREGESFYLRLDRIDELTINLDKMHLQFKSSGLEFRASSWLLERLIELDVDIEEALLNSILNCVWGPGGFRVRALYSKGFKDVAER